MSEMRCERKRRYTRSVFIGGQEITRVQITQYIEEQREETEL
jgi:hypothetical protein